MAGRTAAGGTLVLGGGFAGGYVARLLAKRGAARYRMLGQVATLGRYKGIAKVLRLRLRGFPG